MITARTYPLKDYNKALEDKERSGGILLRITGDKESWYEVRYIPPPAENKWFEHNLMCINMGMLPINAS